MARLGLVLTGSAAILISACGQTADRPTRSPADYPPPPPEVNGEVIGADRETPQDKLMTGPRVGPGGVAPAEGRGTTEPKKK